MGVEPMSPTPWPRDHVYSRAGRKNGDANIGQDACLGVLHQHCVLVFRCLEREIVCSLESECCSRELYHHLREGNRPRWHRRFLRTRRVTRIRSPFPSESSSGSGCATMRVSRRRRPRRTTVSPGKIPGVVYGRYAAEFKKTEAPGGIDTSITRRPTWHEHDGLEWSNRNR